MARAICSTISTKWEVTPEEEEIIERVNSARYRQYWHVPGYHTGSWDGLVKMYNPRSKTLPSGLVPETIDALRAAGFEVSIDAQPITELPLRVDGQLNYTLDQGHQVRVLEAMLTHKRGIVHAATNAGKTKIAQAWCAHYRARVLYLVPSKELLRQTVESFKRDTNLDVGWISAEEGWRAGKDVTVCLVSSVAKRKNRAGKVLNEKAVERFLNLAPGFNAVIVDECHHLTAETWRWVLKQLKNATHRYGLSGSPWQHRDLAEALRVKALLGPIIASVSNGELVGKGWSAKPLISMVDVKAEHLIKSDDYASVYETGIVYNVLRNNMIVKICRQFQEQGKTCLVISTRIAQCEILGDMLSSVGVENRVVIGQTHKSARSEDLKDFKGRKFPVLISNVLSEGVDIPSLNALVFSSGGKSSKQMLQRVGRGVRKKLTGRNEVEIYDFIDNCHSYLLRHTLERVGLYEREGFEVRVIEIKF